MKTKILIAAFATMFLCACSEDTDGVIGAIEDHHDGIEYLYNNNWENAHEKVIDITNQPNNFVLEFRTTVSYTIQMPDGYESIRCTMLDSIIRDSITGEIMNKPIYASRPYRYLQRIRFETNGEKYIEADFHYVNNGPISGSSRIVLTRE